MLGLSRFAAARTALGAPRPEGVDVGLYTEADARHAARTVEEHARAAGTVLAVEPRPCISLAELESARTRARRWWRTVQGLRLVAIGVALTGVVLVGAELRTESTKTIGQALSSPDGYVRVHAQRDGGVPAVRAARRRALPGRPSQPFSTCSRPSPRIAVRTRACR